MKQHSSPLIEVDNLQKSYSAGTSVLKGISAQIKAGESVALIGSNGAGKSTLLKCLAGLHENSGGRISIFNETFERFPSRMQQKTIRKRIGFVFQAHGLVKRLTAHSNVVHGFLGQPGSWRAFTQATACQEWRIKATEALETVKLADKSSARVDQLSGGQAQRVAIARALVRQPDLMIADEPAASLDPTSGHEVMRQFVDLTKDKGITLVFTSHNMEHALTYADRVIALKAGKILIDAESCQLKQTDLGRVFDG
ncbi:MAG: ATP-binding cassette domain-containing protein [Pseudomonadota bacterium]